MATPIGSPNHRRLSNKQRRLIVCLSATAAIILALALIFLTLGLTVFKARDPITTVDSISIADLDFSIDILKFRIHLNVSFDAAITVKNPNRVGFKFANTSAVLRYRGNDVGEVPVPAGKIGARSAVDLNLTLTLMADRLISDSDFFSDVVSGELEFQTYIRVSGKVRILFNVHVVAYATCDLRINLITRKVVDQTCHYKTKL